MLGQFIAAVTTWLRRRARNRHVPLQITPGDLRYQHDHVLDDLVVALGLQVQVVKAPFPPGGGAYGRGHAHGHEHGHHHEH